MIKFLQLKFISYHTDFSFQAAPNLLINEIHEDNIPHGQWHLLYFSCGVQEILFPVGRIR